MVELTDREKVIILEIGFLFNPQVKTIPMDLRVMAVKTLLATRRIDFSEDELKDLAHAIDKEQKNSIAEGFGFLGRHPEISSVLKDFKF